MTDLTPEQIGQDTASSAKKAAEAFASLTDEEKAHVFDIIEGAKQATPIDLTEYLASLPDVEMTLTFRNESEAD